MSTSYDLARKQRDSFTELSMKVLRLMTYVDHFDKSPDSDKYDCDDPKGNDPEVMAAIHNVVVGLSYFAHGQEKLVNSILADIPAVEVKP